MVRDKNIQHRGLECENWLSLPKGEDTIEIYNGFWRRFGISSGQLRISPLNIGEYIVVITDPTLMEVEKTNGKVKVEKGFPIPKQGGSNGFYVDDSDFEPTLDAVYAVLDASLRENHGIALPFDVMYNRNNDKSDRLTKTVLNLETLTDNQKKKLKLEGLDKLIGQPLTLGDFEKIYGSVKDKEFYVFPEHSTEGRVKLLSKFEQAIKNQEQISITGQGKSAVRVIPFQKDGLYPLVPPDERGQGSNHWDRIFQIWYAGRQGDEGRVERKVFVAGACIDYSVNLTAQWLKDTGHDVTIIAPAVKGLGIIPKTVMLRNLAEAYAVNIVWDWPEELGEAPKNWDNILSRIKENDIKQFEAASGPGSWTDFVKSVEKYQPR